MIENKFSDDMEIAKFFGEHIENPCNIEVKGEPHTLREFYIRESKERILSTMKDKNAINYLGGIISRYE